MGLSVINGLPAHVLLVHIVVVFVPLTALLLIASSLWPAARRRLGITTPVVALITLVAIPPTMSAGDWLVSRVAPGPLVYAHTHIADTLLPFALGVFVLAVLGWVLYAKQHWFVRGSTPQGGDERILVGSSVAGVSPSPAAAEGATLIEPGTQATGAVPPVVPNWLRVVRIVVAVFAVAVSVGSVVVTYQIGDSGAKAAWHGNFSTTPKTGG